MDFCLTKIRYRIMNIIFDCLFQIYNCPFWIYNCPLEFTTFCNATSSILLFHSSPPCRSRESATPTPTPSPSPTRAPRKERRNRRNWWKRGKKPGGNCWRQRKKGGSRPPQKRKRWKWKFSPRPPQANKAAVNFVFGGVRNGCNAGVCGLQGPWEWLGLT